MEKIYQKAEEVLVEQLNKIQTAKCEAEKETACKIIEAVSRIIELINRQSNLDK